VKKFLYNAIGWIGQKTIQLTYSIGNITVEIVRSLFGAIIFIIANLFRLVLLLIDKERTEYAAEAIQQSPINLELKILGWVSQVKEDALQREDWTEKHSNAIRVLAARLYNECDWRERDVHRYMKGVVESIPGLYYSVEGWNDDDDDDDQEFAFVD
jgi:hypothetical protein